MCETAPHSFDDIYGVTPREEREQLFHDLAAAHALIGDFDADSAGEAVILYRLHMGMVRTEAEHQALVEMLHHYWGGVCVSVADYAYENVGNPDVSMLDVFLQFTSIMHFITSESARWIGGRTREDLPNWWSRGVAQALEDQLDLLDDDTTDDAWSVN